MLRVLGLGVTRLNRFNKVMGSEIYRYLQRKLWFTDWAFGVMGPEKLFGSNPEAQAPKPRIKSKSKCHAELNPPPAKPVRCELPLVQTREEALQNLMGGMSWPPSNIGRRTPMS